MRKAGTRCADCEALANMPPQRLFMRSTCLSSSRMNRRTPRLDFIPREKKDPGKKGHPLLALPFLENFHAKVFHLIDDSLRFLTGIEQLAEEPGISCPKLFLACH